MFFFANLPVTSLATGNQPFTTHKSELVDLYIYIYKMLWFDAVLSQITLKQNPFLPLAFAQVTHKR